jgi:hypothetical protein
MTDDFLMTYLRQVTDHFKPPMAPIERFVLEVGRDFVAARRPRGIGKRRDGMCFMHAFQLAMERKELEYAEGMAMRPDLPIAMHHAWCVTKSGVVVDDTWKDPERCRYRGVIISGEELLVECLKSGIYGVLDTGRGANLKLMEKIRRRARERC